MATLPEDKNTPPVIEAPVDTVPGAPVVEGGMEVYNSSEEFQRAHAAGLRQQKIDEEKQQATTEKEKIKVVLNKYINKYSKTTETRKRAKANNKSADHQLDVDAEVVEILEKIKNELR